MLQSVDFINPNRKWEIYGSMGCLALAAGTLFTRNQVVKIIGTTVLSSSVAFTTSKFINGTPVCKHFENNDYCKIRSENRFIHSIGMSLYRDFFVFFTVVGAIFSLTSRVPLSFLKRKVSFNQFASVWISGLALTVLVSELNVCRDKKRKILIPCCFASIVLINIGIIAYRTGIFSKKPS